MHEKTNHDLRSLISSIRSGADLLTHKLDLILAGEEKEMTLQVLNLMNDRVNKLKELISNQE